MLHIGIRQRYIHHPDGGIMLLYIIGNPLAVSAAEYIFLQRYDTAVVPG